MSFDNITELNSKSIEQITNPFKLQKSTSNYPKVEQKRREKTHNRRKFVIVNGNL